MLIPKRLFLSYPGLRIVSFAFRASLAPPPNRFFSSGFLQVNKSVTSLDMSENFSITDQGWTEIAKGLAVHISLFGATSYCTTSTYFQWVLAQLAPPLTPFFSSKS